MTKSELVEAIGARAELTRMRADLVVSAVFDAIVESLRNGHGVEIRGFGSFRVRTHKPYEGRNPRTGRLVQIPPNRLPHFRVGKELRELVNASRQLGAIKSDSNDDGE